MKNDSQVLDVLNDLNSSIKNNYVPEKTETGQ